MQNPFKSDDDAGRDEAEGKEAASDEQSKAGEYRDDEAAFGQSSDYAQRGSTGQYAGGGPGDEGGNYPSTRESKGAHAGSQEQWRGASAQQSGPSDTQQTSQPAPDGSGAAPTGTDGSEAYGDVPSRSADPGQSSYGGFKNEGPSPNDAMQQKASDRDRPTPTDEADAAK